jgi:hypothetical protein
MLYFTWTSIRQFTSLFFLEVRKTAKYKAEGFQVVFFTHSGFAILSKIKGPNLYLPCFGLGLSSLSAVLNMALTATDKFCKDRLHLSNFANIKMR